MPGRNVAKDGKCGRRKMLREDDSRRKYGEGMVNAEEERW